LKLSAEQIKSTERIEENMGKIVSYVVRTGSEGTEVVAFPPVIRSYFW
jgi:hypothetical protein